jgi:folate-binding protein YgfZ
MNQFEYLSDRVVISCIGTHAQKFLQGIVTNDVLQNSSYSMMLSPTGKFLFDFFIYQVSPEHYLIDAASEKCLDKIRTYKLRNDVELSNISERYAVLYATKATDFMRSFYLFSDTRHQNMGVRCILPKTFFANLDFTQNQPGLYAKAKYQNTIPDGELDMISEKSFPLEFGLSELNGVSYTKGCYLGQEIIARTYHTGVIRKHLYKVIASGGSSLQAVDQGSDILQEGLKVGSFCSGYSNLGIALVRSEDIDSKSNVTLCGEKILLEKASWHSPLR